MDFDLTAAQRELIDDVSRFTSTELEDNSAENDRLARFDVKAWRQCAEFGVLGWPVPRQHGGSGLDLLSCVLGFEAFGYGCRDNGLLFAINNHVWATTSYLLRHGTPEQRDRFLPSLADGSAIGAHALTEPDAGSDVLSMSAVAVSDGDGYVLNGVKTFISNAPVADLFVVFARTGTGLGQRGLSAFLVPGQAAGVRLARSWDKAGLRGCPMGEVSFEDVRLGRDSLLGREGAGYQIFTAGAECERGFMFASQVGTLRRLVRMAAAQAASRRQFGRPIGDFQAVSHRLADLEVRLEAARLMLYRFGWLKQQGRMAPLESAMLKLHVSEAMLAAAVDTMRTYGARGYLTDFGIEREVRDAMAATIYSGTSDVQREIIAKLTAGLTAGTDVA